MSCTPRPPTSKGPLTSDGLGGLGAQITPEDYLQNRISGSLSGMKRESFPGGKGSCPGYIALLPAFGPRHPTGSKAEVLSPNPVKRAVTNSSDTWSCLA